MEASSAPCLLLSAVGVAVAHNRLRARHRLLLVAAPLDVVGDEAVDHGNFVRSVAERAEIRYGKVIRIAETEWSHINAQVGDYGIIVRDLSSHLEEETAVCGTNLNRVEIPRDTEFELIILILVLVIEREGDSLRFASAVARLICYSVSTEDSRFQTYLVMRISERDVRLQEVVERHTRPPVVVVDHNRRRGVELGDARSLDIKRGAATGRHYAIAGYVRPSDNLVSVDRAILEVERDARSDEQVSCNGELVGIKQADEMIHKETLARIVAHPHEAESTIEMAEEVISGESIILVSTTYARPLISVVDTETRSVCQTCERRTQIERRLIGLRKRSVLRRCSEWGEREKRQSDKSGQCFLQILHFHFIAPARDVSPLPGGVCVRHDTKGSHRIISLIR